MANTIPTAVSSLGDSFECIVLDSARVSTLSVASTSADTVHELGETTTLMMVSVGTEGSGVLVYRGDVFNGAKSWHLRPGDHPFNVAGGSRTLRFRAVDTATTTKILEN
ncbi:hypothetical protein [Rhizobium sp. LCM 4573]|uniref:hypothetical protein n=1 Tax=Rhizobium sp. LCM 4573 TaxID=1848291 RepID=UPI0008DB1C53|nr:hypothetical protein [Rhizobium sp. LCM 4573]OHV83654.1 hypothetical protein LCM4573_05990 [Rhizobium sp. LCM 4573]